MKAQRLVVWNFSELHTFRLLVIPACRICGQDAAAATLARCIAA
jgi:hypothetical protein